MLFGCVFVLCIDSCFGYGVCLIVSARMMFFFQAEDGIRDLVRSRGLGDVYKRQLLHPDSVRRDEHRAVNVPVSDGKRAAARKRGARHQQLAGIPVGQVERQPSGALGQVHDDRRAVRRHGQPRPELARARGCLLYTSPSPRDRTRARMPSSA